MSIGFVIGAVWKRFYGKGVRQEIQIPQKSLIDLFEESCAENRDKVGAVFLDESYTYSSLKSEVERFATALLNLGISKGDVVALLLPNSVQFIISYYGALKAGATVAPMNPLNTAHEIQLQAEKAKAKAIVCLDIFYEKVAQATPTTSIKHIIVTNIADYLPAFKKTLGKLLKKIPTSPIPRKKEVYKFRELIRSARGGGSFPRLEPEEDIASLQFTGGTTGIPKCAILTHQNIVANIFQIQEMINPYLKLGDEVFAALLPFYHIYGQTVILGAGLTTGNKLVIFPRLELEKFIRDLSRYRVTVFPGVPTLFNAMAKSPIVKECDLSNLKLVISGADFLPKEVAAEFKKVVGKEIVQGYGLTEASPVTHLNPPDNVKPNSIGIPLPSTLAGIVNPENLEFLSPGNVGELVVSGPQVMRGYLGDSDKVFFEAYGRRWLRTGDICVMDEEGYFYFVERAKDIIKHKGFTIYPAEIENVLLESGEVKEAAVIGVPDKHVGEKVVAVVVPRSESDKQILVEKLSKYCGERLAEYKRPHEIIVTSELPKSAVGKVLRRKIREGLLHG
ncbi:Long-chain-fatty-acid--CoA ligase [archaeon HR01]|nr:Long-chain-fatty-acid--CoA ligase [archaeon HR01]